MIVVSSSAENVTDSSSASARHMALSGVSLLPRFSAMLALNERVASRGSRRVQPPYYHQAGHCLYEARPAEWCAPTAVHLHGRGRRVCFHHPQARAGGARMFLPRQYPHRSTETLKHARCARSSSPSITVSIEGASSIVSILPRNRAGNITLLMRDARRPSQRISGCWRIGWRPRGRGRRRGARPRQPS